MLNQLKSGQSPSPFSLTDEPFNQDLLLALTAIADLLEETPFRIFSVRVFNNSKRLDNLKPALIRLARIANPEWKPLPAEELLRELNLVANPGFIQLSGNWQFTTENGELLSLSGFGPSVGFPAAQTAAIQAVTVHAEAVLCIENLTTFHEFARAQEIAQRNTEHATRDLYSMFRSTIFAVICINGNPSPAIRHILRLVPETTPVHLWSDMDYGGFNILSQLRKQVSPRIQPYRMDIPTFESHAHLARPLTQTDERNLKRLCLRPELQDVRLVIEHLLKRGVKLEQEAIRL